MEALRRICVILLLAAVLSGCSRQKIAPLVKISEYLGVDVTGGILEESWDTHGGFHGDGETFARIRLETAPEGEGWTELPLTENLEILLYGGTYLTDEDGKALLPQVKNGSYYFYDRHSQAEDPADDANVLSRGSFNFTLAVYDSDEGILYFFVMDT